MPNAIDLTSMTFGNWEVKKKAQSRSGKTYWLCECRVCHKQQEIQTCHLRAGTYKKCCEQRPLLTAEGEPVKRVCPICGKGFNLISRGYTRKFCFECSPTYGRGQNGNRAQTITALRRAIKRQLVAYKGGRCEICGYNKCVGALQFHHVDPQSKDFEISTDLKLGNLDMVSYYKEVDKCMLVCANCHAELHEKEYEGS